MLVVNGTDGINFQPPVGHDASKIGMTDMIDNVIGSFFQISTLFKRLNMDGTYLGEMHSDLAIYIVLVTNDKKCHALKRNLINTLIFGRPTSAPTLRTLQDCWTWTSLIWQFKRMSRRKRIWRRPNLHVILVGWGSASHQRRETFHSLLLESIFSPSTCVGG